MGTIKRFFIVCFACIVFVYGDCFAAIECDTGYEEIDYIDESTFMAPVNGACQVGGYSLIEIPDEIYPIYSGFLMGATVTLCDNGYYNGSTCVSYEQSTCENNEYALGTDDSSFMAPANNSCQVGGYALLNLPDSIRPIYSGFLMGSEVTLCNNGYYNGSTCVSYTQGDCPNNYIDLALNENTFAKLSSGLCATGYERYSTTQCSDNSTEDLCSILCTGDLKYTEVGTCASLCDLGLTALVTGNGQRYPLYSEKQITPSINVSVGDGTCYVNLVAGNQTGSINVNYNNQTYHTVE